MFGYRETLGNSIKLFDFKNKQNYRIVNRMKYLKNKKFDSPEFIVPVQFRVSQKSFFNLRNFILTVF